ncbi:MAG: hypothetical protein WC196_05215 [Bacilli bacterium]|jgi:hypothetical protein
MTYTDQIQVALVETEKEPERSDVVTLSTGVVLKHKPFSIMRIQDVADRFPYPPIPKVFNPDKGRHEEWAGSEEYSKAVQEIDRKRGMAVVDTIMSVGTEVVSIPPDFPKPEDEGWIEELEITGISVKKDSKIARYFAWIKFIATVTESDLEKIMSFTGKTVGNSEVNVADQLHKNFPDN